MHHLILLSFIFFFSLCSEEIPMKLEHAITPEQMAQGLMERNHLDEDAGMTFNYGNPRKIRIWMYNCKIDLSLAFLDANKVIQEIHELKCFPHIKDPNFFDQMSVSNNLPATYALEMNTGWFAKHGVQVGDKVVWDVNSPEGKIIKQ